MPNKTQHESDACEHEAYEYAVESTVRVLAKVIVRGVTVFRNSRVETSLKCSGQIVVKGRERLESMAELIGSTVRRYAADSVVGGADTD